MPQKKFRIKERTKFFLERQFVKGAQYQLLFVAALIGLISVVGGILVLPSGEPTGNLAESIWWAFLRLSDPGYLGDDEGIWRRFISTLITVAGYVVFLGSLVAIITTWLNRKIRNLEQGLTPVAANNHVLILGWTNRTIHIAAELFQSTTRMRRFLQRHKARTLQLIILADDVTPDRLQELKDHRLIGARAHEIILRSGVAIDREHLRRVDSGNAAAIIIPSQTYGVRELITPDVETIKALLSLNAEMALQPKKPMPLVVAEIQDENKIKAAYRAYSGPLEVVASDSIMSRLVAQNIRHAGLSAVYNELLSRSVHNNLFVHDYPELVGQTLDSVKKYFPRVVVLGVVRPQNDGYKPMLNQPEDYQIQPDDRLVLLARNSSDIEIPEVQPARKDDAKEILQDRGHLIIEEQVGVIRVLILGWNHHIPALIKEFGTYEDESYEVTIVSLRPLEEREQEMTLVEEATARVQVGHVVADYVREAELKRVKPGEYDHILLVSSDRLAEEEEADARTIVGYILLEGILEQASKRPQVLMELSDPSNEALIGRFRSEVVIGPMILSHLLAEIALRRELHSIYNELFTVGGAEIIFRNLEEYGLQPGHLKFHELEKRASEFHETALGIYTEGSAGKKPHLSMNPHRNNRLELTREMKLVVLTTIY